MAVFSSTEKSYRHSKLIENPKLKNIPDHWKFIKLKYIGNIITGKTPRGAKYSENKKKIIPFIKPEDLDQGYHLVKAEKSFDYVYMKELSIIPEKSTLVTCIGATLGKIGFSRMEAATNQQINSIVPNLKKITNKYLFYSLISSYGFNEIKRNSKFTTLAIIKKSSLNNIKIPLPPIDEQFKIVDYLDKEISKMDTIISKKQRLIEVLKEKRQSLITQTVTKGLDSNVPLQDSGIAWLDKIPKNWEIMKLKYLAKINELSLGENTDPDYNFHYVEIGDVSLDGLKTELPIVRFEDAPSRARRIVRKNDVIISTVRTYLKAIAWFPNPPGNLIASTGFAVISSLNIVNPNYLYFFIRSQGFIDTVMANSVGISYPAINSSVLANLPICVPPEEEQNLIVSRLDTQNQKINKLISKIEQQILLLEEYRQTLITNVVTGKIDVRGEM